MPPASQVPSHSPLQSTATSALAEQAPLHLASHLPVQETEAFASPEHEPLHSTVSLPPVHLGGVASTSHSAFAEQPPAQLAVASTEAVQTGGVKSTASVALSSP